jgi:hypothetical protein
MSSLIFHQIAIIHNTAITKAQTKAKHIKVFLSFGFMGIVKEYKKTTTK